MTAVPEKPDAESTPNGRAGLAANRVTVRLGERTVLRDVDAAAAPGDLIGLIGPNGAGKTTLLRALAGLLAPESGRVSLDGRPLGALRPAARARRIGYLPQQGAVHWRLRVRDVVAMGRLPHRGALARPGPEDTAAVAAALEAVGVEDLADRTATDLSGGERARVLLARALAGQPAYLLADEPVAGLDPYHRLEVMDHFARLARNGTGIVVVLHDLTLAARYCRRLVLLHDGRVAARGDVGTVLSDDNLAQVYRIEARRGGKDDGDGPGDGFVIPWARL